jgi:hypothetical protein
MLWTKDAASGVGIVIFMVGVFTLLGYAPEVGQAITDWVATW